MDYSQLVKDKKTELGDLFTRMDADTDLVNLKKYALTDVNGKAVPRSISVTLNDAAVFAANVESSLGHAVEQVVVESEDEKIDTAEVEDAIKASFASANARLRKQGRFGLNSFFDQSLCRRGRVAARCLFRYEKDELITDITPWDGRFVYYAMGPSGLKWAAYETTKSKDEVESELWAQEIGFTITGKTAPTLDIWDTEHNEIWVDGVKKYEQPHPWGFTPICTQVVPLGSMMADKDSMKYQGESIFFLIRDLIPELNRLASIMQSLNIKELDHALLWKTKEGTQATPPPYKDFTEPGSVTSTDIGGGAEPAPFGQLRQQAWLLHQIIETRIQRGSLSNFEYGTFTQPMSAVALITVGEGRDQVFLPRLGARGLLNQSLASMMIDQIIKTGQSKVLIGTPGHQRTFDVRKLEGQYDIEFNYFVKSPKIDMARMQMAVVAGDLIPDKAKRREILQREDPDEDERQLRWEEAERISPVIKVNRIINDLLELADRGDEDARFEAEVLNNEMQKMLNQPPSTQGQKPRMPANPQDLFKGMGEPAAPGSSAQQAAPGSSAQQAAPGSSAQQAANLQATPQGGQ